MLRLFSTPDSPADPKLSKDIPGLSCGEPYFDYVLIEISIITSIYILLGVTIIINRLRVSHVAVEHVAPYPESLKIKIICLSVMMVGFLISVALAFFDSSFWLNACGHSLIGLCYGIHLLVTALNIAWLKYQYERRIPLQWYQNQLFWGLIGMNYLFSFITCYIINPAQRFTNPDFFLVLYRLLNSTFLMIYTIRRPQDRVEASFNSGLLMHLRTHEERFESEKDSPSRIRRLTSIKDIRRSSDAYSLRSSFLNDYAPPLIVTVANRIQNRRNFKNGNMEILYKINVKIGSLDYKIHRTLEDFRQLEISMIKENVSKGLKSSALDSLHAILSDRDGEKMSNVAFIVFTLQNFFTSICTERLPSSLLEFLEIPEKEYVKLVNRSRSSFHQHDSIKDLEGGKKNGLMRLPSDDFDEEDERRFEAEEEVSPVPQKKERRETVRVNEANSEDYFPYFNVNIIKFKRAATGDYIEFIINLHLTEKPDECWQIGKRYSDFVEVRQHLKGALNIIPPKLPPKLIVVTDDKQLEARRKGLESWLRVVLNEKLYFMPLLFQFVGLNSSYYEWLQDEELYDFSNFKAVIDKTQILMSNNKPYTVYHILLEENTEGILTKRTVVYSIYRRYKEFYQLNQALERRFSNLSAKLPELPPKFAPFLNNKDMAEFRQQSLEKYLNELFTFPDIGDSFAFRKFIHFKRTSETFKSEKEISEHLIDILGDVDSPNISNERMERALSTARSKKDLLDFVKNQAGL